MATAPRMFGKKPGKKKRKDYRESSHQRGYDKQWKRLRDAFIKSNPLCLHCEQRGVTTAAREVDHVIPFDGVNDPKRLYSGNLQSLCRRCHAVKTKREQGK